MLEYCFSDKAAVVAETAQEKAAELAQAAEGIDFVFFFPISNFEIFFSDKAAELKQDAVVAAEAAQEKTAEVAHAVEGKYFSRMLIWLSNILFDSLNLLR